MKSDSGIPRYSVAELNQAIGSLLERALPPGFCWRPPFRGPN